MSEEVHLFTLSSVWEGTSDGDGSLTTSGGELEYGTPSAFGGRPGRLSPEDLLLGALTSCYSISFAYLAERRRLPIVRISVQAEGDVVRQPDRTLKFTAIRLRPTIEAGEIDEKQRAAIEDAAHRAELYCVISNAVRGNVAVSVEPTIL